MTIIQASTLFNAALVGDAFDHGITRDAANGRVNSALLDCLSTAYGLTLPASPLMTVKAINQLLQAPKVVKLAHGPGATAQAVAVVRVLRTLALALADSGRVKALPAILPLPAWACPEALAQAKAAKVAAKADSAPKAPKVRKVTAPGAATVSTPDTAPDTAPGVELGTAPATSADSVQAAINLIVSAAKAGTLSSAQKGALLAALEGAMVSI